MKVIGRNWKAVLSVLLLLVAVLVYVLGYRPRSEAYVMERDQLNAQITALQTTIVENEMYKDVQDSLSRQRPRSRKAAPRFMRTSPRI